MGEYSEMVSALANANPYPRSFLASDKSLSEWQAETRATLKAMLSYAPDAPGLDARVERVTARDGVVCELVSYSQPYGSRSEGFLLRPECAEGKLPCVMAMHDHGGFKYFGKEKITALENEPPILREFKEECYGGRSWATELAKRGYLVFVPDAFLWGSRKMSPELIPEELVGDVYAGAADEEGRIRAYNSFAGNYETMIAKSLFLAGTTWPGIMVYEDMRAVDYLLSRPEADGERLGCCGLSGGGLRTVFLSAVDERVFCSITVGFMSTFGDTAQHRPHCHTWMYHLPTLASLIDFPDLFSLHGNKPLMAQFDVDDPLWTLEGQKASDARLKAVYAKMGSPGLYQGRFYPGPHKFDIPMQEDAFDYYDRWLKA